MIYSLEEHKRVYLLPNGITGQISFERLAQILQRADELLPNETITHFHVKDDGIVFRMEIL